MDGIARVRVLAATAGALVGAWAVLASAGGALAGPSRGLATLQYHGFAVRVPNSWPVFHLAREPQTCVRFNRHAVYLGTPGREEQCPARAVGRTEAILISPLKASKGSPGVTATALHLEGDVTSFAAPSAGVEVTATWSRDPRLVLRALRRKSLPGTAGSRLSISGAAGTSASVGASGQNARFSGSGRVYRGLGFDTCNAPSTSQMSAWSSSPYRAVGIYIGGVNEACAQPNLSRSWVGHEIDSGWHPFPIYVGLQAPDNGCGCTAVSTNAGRASLEGRAAGGDAVNQAHTFGIAPGNPIYYDMEGYATGGTNSSAVLAFLAGWTWSLHAAGYLSGVYSSAGSGVADLVSKHGTGYPEPNDIWIADWNGLRTTSDPYVPAADWPGHQRLHQYAGNTDETYGGVTLNVDDDYLDGATANARNGYMLLTSNGGVHRFGPIPGYGSDAGKLRRGITAVALGEDRKTGGYWILKSNGGVDAYHAHWFGSLKGRLHRLTPVALAGTPSGGYLILTRNGGVRAFHATWYGSDTDRLAHGVRAVGLAVDRKTGGYWILKSNGGVSAFHAPSDGALTGKLGGVRATGLAAAAAGGYYILTADGRVHPFGAARFYGSDAGKLAAGVRAVSIATMPTAAGYRILRSDGGVDCFNAISYGSLMGKVPAGARPLTIAAARG